MKIELAKKEIIHFIGIGGIGMSGLALIMKAKGFQIQGSDINKNKNIEKLKKQGVRIFICLLYTSPSPRDVRSSRMPSSA